MEKTYEFLSLKIVRDSLCELCLPIANHCYRYKEKDTDVMRDFTLVDLLAFRATEFTLSDIGDISGYFDTISILVHNGARFSENGALLPLTTLAEKYPYLRKNVLEKLRTVAEYQEFIEMLISSYDRRNGFVAPEPEPLPVPEPEPLPEPVPEPVIPRFVPRLVMPVQIPPPRLLPRREPPAPRLVSRGVPQDGPLMPPPESVGGRVRKTLRFKGTSSSRTSLRRPLVKRATRRVLPYKGKRRSRVNRR